MRASITAGCRTTEHTSMSYSNSKSVTTWRGATLKGLASDKLQIVASPERNPLPNRKGCAESSLPFCSSGYEMLPHTQTGSRRINQSHRQSQSHFTTDGQSVSMSWCRAQSGTFDQRYLFIFFLNYSLVLFGAPSLTRGRVCHLSVYSQSTHQT
jgi:hypothetical protein